MSSSNRFPYKTATTLTQDVLNECADNLTNSLEMICIIFLSSRVIYVSDRNKYVGDVFYEARVTFPTISRTLGEWLSPDVEFSTLQIDLNNSDGEYNDHLPGGASYAGWVGRDVIVKLGLRDVESTYRTIFRGKITEVGGLSRSISKITIFARDEWDRLKESFPTATFSKTEFPNIEDAYIGQGIPYILGNWSVNLENKLAAVPAIVVNGNDVNVYEDTGPRNNVDTVICINELGSIDLNGIYLKRGSDLWPISNLDITSVLPNNRGFSVIQNTGNTIIGTDNPENFKFSQGDEFFIRCVGKDLELGYGDNIIAQAQEILYVYGNLNPINFSSKWNAYKNKSTPPESNIRSIKSRVWVQDRQEIINYVSSLLEQVRLEPFINVDGLLDLNSMHLEDFAGKPSLNSNAWDVERGTFSPKIDERINFNRAQASYAFDPYLRENAFRGPFFKNAQAVTYAGKAISKEIVFPNLYIDDEVNLQVKEVLKISGAYLEVVNVNTTWRLLLVELGQMLRFTMQIVALQFDNVPMMIRSIGYNPEGMKLEFTLWSLQMVPFPGWAPGFAGISGGTGATIVQE